MVRVLWLCTECGSGFSSTAPEELVGKKVGRVCYSRTCLGTKPHLVVASPSGNREDVDPALLKDIPDPRWLAAGLMEHRLEASARQWLKRHTVKTDPAIRKPYVTPQGIRVVFDRRLGNHDHFRGWVFTSLDLGFVV